MDLKVIGGVYVDAAVEVREWTLRWLVAMETLGEKILW